MIFNDVKFDTEVVLFSVSYTDVALNIEVEGCSLVGQNMQFSLQAEDNANFSL